MLYHWEAKKITFVRSVLVQLVFSSQLDDIIVWHQSEVQRNKMKKL